MHRTVLPTCFYWLGYTFHLLLSLQSHQRSPTSPRMSLWMRAATWPWSAWPMAVLNLSSPGDTLHQLVSSPPVSNMPHTTWDSHMLLRSVWFCKASISLVFKTLKELWHRSYLGSSLVFGNVLIPIKSITIVQTYIFHFIFNRTLPKATNLEAFSAFNDLIYVQNVCQFCAWVSWGNILYGLHLHSSLCVFCFALLFNYCSLICRLCEQIFQE